MRCHSTCLSQTPIPMKRRQTFRARVWFQTRKPTNTLKYLLKYPGHLPTESTTLSAKTGSKPCWTILFSLSLILPQLPFPPSLFFLPPPPLNSLLFTYQNRTILLHYPPIITSEGVNINIITQHMVHTLMSSIILKMAYRTEFPFSHLGFNQCSCITFLPYVSFVFP